VVNRTLSGTNNYKPHYKKYHPDIPTSVEEEQRMQRVQQDKANKQFYKKPEEEQSHNERFRTVVLSFLNLSPKITSLSVLSIKPKPKLLLPSSPRKRNKYRRQP
jgi:hypothetical protein